MCDVRCAAGWKNQKYVRCALQVAIPKWCIYLCVLQKRLSDMSVLKTPTHSNANCTYVGVLQWFWIGAVFETARWNPVKFWKASPSQFAMIKDMIKSTHMVQKFWDRHVFWCMQVASKMLSNFTQGPSLCSNMFLLQDQQCAKIVQPSEGIFQHDRTCFSAWDVEALAWLSLQVWWWPLLTHVCTLHSLLAFRCLLRKHKLYHFSLWTQPADL